MRSNSGTATSRCEIDCRAIQSLTMRAPLWQLSRALLFAGLVACSSSHEDAKASPPYREAAEPVAGLTELLALPHGDTLTVPVGFQFLQFQGIDSLGGRLQDGAGRAIFDYDACGNAGERISAANGTLDYSVNAEFFYSRHSKSWPSLLVTFPTRGPSNLFFDEAISDEEALDLAHTLTAILSQAENTSKLCRFL